MSFFRNKNESPLCYQKRDLKKPLVFLHIPKTAGTALHQLIDKNFRRESVYILGVDGVSASNLSFSEKLAQSKDWLMKSSVQDKSGIKTLIGHISFGVHEYFPNGAQYVTLIRHPVSRIISHFNYVKKTEGHYLHNLYDIKSMSLVDYIECVKSPELNNGQVRILSNSESSVDYGECTDDMLYNACQNISNYFLSVGLQEKFDESIKEICSSAYLENTNISNVNISKSDGIELTPSCIGKIIELNLLDLTLYELILRGKNWES